MFLPCNVVFVFLYSHTVLQVKILKKIIFTTHFFIDKRFILCTINHTTLENFLFPKGVVDRARPLEVRVYTIDNCSIFHGRK
jgi:hypothetical protein